MRRRYFLFVLPILFLCSCNRIVEQDFFPVPIETVDVPEKKVISLSDESFFCSSMPFSLIKDSVIVSLERGTDTHLVSVTDMAKDSIMGLFCQKGRANNELLDCIPISELYSDSEENLCADLVSYKDSRLFKWNISESLKSGKDVYDKIVELKSGRGLFLPLMSLYRLDEKRIITRNSVRSPKEGSIHEPPAYEIYDTDSGQKMREYAFMNSVEAPDYDHDGYDDRAYVSMSDCIKPDRTKVAFAMSYMSVYGILDIESGKLDVFRVKRSRRFSATDRYRHFASLAADDSFIYALYRDGISREALEAYSLLYVIDWQGKIRHLFTVESGIWSIDLDGDLLYFLKRDGCIKYIHTSELV